MLGTMVAHLRGERWKPPHRSPPPLPPSGVSGRTARALPQSSRQGMGPAGWCPTSGTSGLVREALAPATVR